MAKDPELVPGYSNLATGLGIVSTNSSTLSFNLLFIFELLPINYFMESKQLTTVKERGVD